MGGAFAALVSEDTTMKQGTGTWYTEKGTYTVPSDVPGMVTLMRAGKFLALVPAETKGEKA